ncbi:MAG: hypothetical protein AB7V14_07010 [Kiritimatiellia bacterium]
MKKYLMTALTIALSAGTALAQDPGGNGPSPLQGARGNCEMGGPPMQGRQAMRGNRRMMDPETMAQMRADQKAIMELGAAARAETDETKKAEIVAQIRAKFGEAADRRAANHQKRIAQAEKTLADLKTKFEEDTANRDALIEKQIARVLAGERPMMPQRDRRFPQAKGAMPEGPEGEMPPPPAGEDVHSPMPPPPMGDAGPEGARPPPPMGDEMPIDDPFPPPGE